MKMYKLFYMTCCFGLVLPSLVYSEGSAQLGSNQDLVELERNIVDGGETAGPPVILGVDILEPGETINVAAGSNGVSSPVRAQIWRPGQDPYSDPTSYELIINPGDPAFLSNADNPVVTIINNPLRVVTDETGTWYVHLRNGSSDCESSTDSQCAVDPFDITVTPPGYSGPVYPYQPPEGFGRVFSRHWNLNANDYTNCMNRSFYAVSNSGFSDRGYLWQAELNGYCGYYYSLVANTLGIDGWSGYSTDLTALPAPTVLPVYPLYLNLPEIFTDNETQEPSISDYLFTDSAGVDQTISPTTTAGMQDDGVFSFTTNFAVNKHGTYSIVIDCNQDGSFDPHTSSDVLLKGIAHAGLNEVPWDGLDGNGLWLPEGVYSTRISLRSGELHFPAYDVEFAEEGVRIFEMIKLQGSTPSDPLVAIPTWMYWDDSQLPDTGNGNIPTTMSSLFDASNSPISTGESSDAPSAGINTHAWGVGLARTTAGVSMSSGETTLIDTMVIGSEDVLTATGTIIINSDDGTDLDSDCLPNLNDPEPLVADSDNDNFTPCDGDCNDGDPLIYPGATEVCDNADNDCDLSIDEEILCGIIGDFSWHDINGNGVQDDTEPGFEGVTVNLRVECSIDEVLTTTTDNDGMFLFSGLPPGSYQLEFVRPDGFLFSPLKAAGDYTKDSNAAPDTGLDLCRTMSEGQNRLALDAGLVSDILIDKVTINIHDLTVNESIGTAAIEVSLNTVSPDAVTVRYATKPFGAAIPGEDFRGRSGTLLFNPGQTSKIIPVPVLDDVIAEPTEDFVVRLFTPVNATIQDDQATVTILDDDSSAADSVAIVKAIYFVADNKLWIKANSDAVPEGSATITATMIINGVETALGTVSWKADKGAYQQLFRNINQQPDTVVLSSSFGGSASGVVETQ